MLTRGCLGLLALGLVALGCESDERLCTLISCGPAHQTRLEVDSAEPGSQLTVETCFNDACESVSGVEPNIVHGIELLGRSVAIDVVLFEPEPRRSLEVSWHFPASVAKAGDRYTVSLTTADGTIVADSVELATRYEETYPNGKDCDREGCAHVVSTETLSP